MLKKWKEIHSFQKFNFKCYQNFWIPLRQMCHTHTSLGDDFDIDMILHFVKDETPHVRLTTPISQNPSRQLETLILVTHSHYNSLFNP